MSCTPSNPLAELLALSIACEAVDGSEEHDRDLYSRCEAPEDWIDNDGYNDRNGREGRAGCQP
jgi:hypothetical protein